MPSNAAAPAPAGYDVDLQNPQTRDLLAGLVVGFIGIAISTAFVVLRVYTKAIIVKIFVVEDVCLFVSWILALALQVIVICRFIPARNRE